MRCVQSATMFGMDPKALAFRVRRLQSWMESRVSSPTWSSQQFDRPPFGHAEVTIDAASNSPAASFNRNRICLCGSEGGLTRDGLTEMIRLFDAQRVKRFFVWLSPGPLSKSCVNGSQHSGSSKCPGLAIPRWCTAGRLSIGGHPPDDPRGRPRRGRVGSFAAGGGHHGRLRGIRRKGGFPSLHGVRFQRTCGGGCAGALRRHRIPDLRRHRRVVSTAWRSVRAHCAPCGAGACAWLYANRQPDAHDAR